MKKTEETKKMLLNRTRNTSFIEEFLEIKKDIDPIKKVVALNKLLKDIESLFIHRKKDIEFSDLILEKGAKGTVTIRELEELKRTYNPLALIYIFGFISIDYIESKIVEEEEKICQKSIDELEKTAKSLIIDLQEKRAYYDENSNRKSFDLVISQLEERDEKELANRLSVMYPDRVYPPSGMADHG